MKRFIQGIGSLLLLLVLIVGVPAALVMLAGNPIPTLEELQRVATMPDFGGEFLIGSLLPIIAWVAWALFALGFLVELPAQIRGIQAPRLPALVPQHSAGVLIASVLVLFTGISVAAGPATSATALELGQVQSTVDAEYRAVAETPVKVADLPAPVAATPPAPTEVERTIVPGDTLWDIAEQELGDGNRYPEIYEATKADQQPDGRFLTDPNLIYPGWEVDIPVAAAAPAAPAPAQVPVQPPADTTTEAVQEETAAADAGTVGAEGSGSAEGAGAAEATGAGESNLSGLGIGQSDQQTTQEQASSIDVDGIDDAAWDDSSFLVGFTAGGISGFLAAGLLTVLGIRRVKQRRRRKPGQRISMPREEITPMELELRTVENPMGMDDVDHALRHIAAWAQRTDTVLPPVYAVRLATTEISIYIDVPADLPAPFVAVSDDRMAWIVDPEELPALERIPSSPYPALVTIGHDASEGHILVDLEHIGALNLSGSKETSAAALTALAVELATSQWAEDLQITLVGVAEGLPTALDSGRVRHFDDVETLLRNLRGQAKATEEALASLNVATIEEARSLSPDADAWIPEIVILGELPAEDVRAELAELVTRLPRVGIASVTAGHLVGDWTLELGDDHTATLQPLGLQLTPQLVDQVEYAKILELISATDAEAVDGTAVFEPELELSEIPMTIADTAPVSPLSVVPPLEETDDDDSWKDELRRLLPPESFASRAPKLVDEDIPVDVEAIDQVDVDEATTEAETGTTGAVTPLHAAPSIRLLGTVALHGARGEEPRTPKTSETNRSAVARATELVAFLSLNRGANAVEVHQAFWPAADPSGSKASTNRNALTHKARKWLGNNDAGEPYLPPVGSEGYRLHEDVRSDWDLWLDLVGDDPSKATTDDLVQALKLVDGQPFSGVKERYYVWAERIRQEMIASIGDAAHELATRALRTHDVANARLAATIGRQVDPVNETLWRDALRAEHQAGDIRGVERVVKQLEDYLESFEDGYEAEPETQQLIAEVRQLAHAS
jgi:DNA-binding SARP family transcriptional activator